ncbi:MAG: hypothetical protein WB557_09165 [Solirubrobacteraceae bacterium]
MPTVVLELVFGIVLGPGSALVTRAIETLLPIVSDARELRTRLGTYLLAAGSVGEIGPVLLLAAVRGKRCWSGHIPAQVDTRT